MSIQSSVSSLATLRGVAGQPMVDPLAGEKARAAHKAATAKTKAARKAAAVKRHEEIERARLARAARKAAKAEAKAQRRLVKSEGTATLTQEHGTAQDKPTQAQLQALRQAWGADKRYKDRNPKPTVDVDVVEEEYSARDEELEVWLYGIDNGVYDQPKYDSGDGWNRINNYINSCKSKGVRWMLKRYLHTNHWEAKPTAAQLRSDLAAFNDIYWYLQKSVNYIDTPFANGKGAWGGGDCCLDSYKLAHSMLDCGIRFSEQVDRVLAMLDENLVEKKQWSSNSQVNIRRVVQLVLSYPMLSVDALNVVYEANLVERYDRYSCFSERKPGVKALLVAISAWKHAPQLPYRLAYRLGKQFSDKPSLLKIASGVWHDITSGEYETNQALNDFWVRFSEVLRSPNRKERAQLMWQGNAATSGVRYFYGNLSRDAEEAVYKELRTVQKDAELGLGMYKPEFPVFKAKALSAILELEESRQFKSGALRLAVTFGNNWKQWLSKNEKLNRSFHDCTYWLPLVTGKGLDSFLLKYADRVIGDLELVCRAWVDLTPEQKALSFKELVLECKSCTYVGASSKVFAVEAAQWGVNHSYYKGFEARFIASQEQPDFHPEVKVQIGGLKGGFMSRSDARGVFLGQYTNCCQHPHGVGAACAWYGQESKHSGFFVVEDKQGEILAQSWTWETAEGICFDNVEAKGLGDRDNAVGELYKLAAQQLAGATKLVTMGTGLGDLRSINLIGITDGRSLNLPKDYSGYSDAKGAQYVLAENPNAVGLQEETQVTYVRGMLEDDLPLAETVAREVYPSGWQFAGSHDTDYGLVLMHEDQVVGYSCMETGNRYVADIAVLETARKFSRKLVDATLAYCRRVGGEWTADCRESTSYKLMKLYERRGRVVIREEAVNGDLNGEALHQLRFAFN